jgi:hypothetical protein
MYNSSSQTVVFANCGFQDTRYIWYCYNVFILSFKIKIMKTVVMDISVLRCVLYAVTKDIVQGDSFGTRPKKMRISQRLFTRFWINFCNIFTYKYIYNFINIKYIYKILNWITNSLWDIRIFLGLVPKESPCTSLRRLSVTCTEWV